MHFSTTIMDLATRFVEAQERIAEAAAFQATLMERQVAATEAMAAYRPLPDTSDE
jgi:hypothetical protein